ncbi:MAG: tripartite tricarboxylate transporter TctB family protein [Planctomycetes bacterium]|nr:tripartite tricarboxylate transporter TctB family protein [Planctomycetota bacterium]
MPKLNALRVMTIASVAFSVWFYYLTLSYPRDAAMLPRGLLILFAACAAALFIRSCLGDNANERLGLKHPKRLLAGVAAAILYIAGVFALGYYLASALFIITLAVLLRYRNTVFIAIAAIFFPLSIYVVFQIFLKVPMPAGFIF